MTVTVNLRWLNFAWKQLCGVKQTLLSGPHKCSKEPELILLVSCLGFWSFPGVSSGYADTACEPTVAPHLGWH